ncbi:MAG: UDP-3-O-(3-hydroxymyristoyl)glucosamine N-acyltransferase [candidate division Zixibacteria bacterium]|nr:UDP-3-O-(3-hydroxymyristoyl)glucosamine N-acyltransferase [candidate division Zixibacteria bacterium]
MTVTLRELAGQLQARLVGDGDTVLTGVAGIEDAGSGHLTFLANPKYAQHLKLTRASAILLPPESATFRVNSQDVPPGLALLFHPNPYYAFLQALRVFHPGPPAPEPGVDCSARIGKRVHLADGVHVGPNCVIEDNVSLGTGSVILAGSFVGTRSVIGEDCCIGPTTSILPGCTLGNRVRIHPGTVIGSDGFGYAPYQGRHHKIPQVGGVTVGDDVEIGACCAIDRATMGQTTIGRGTKIDNLVQIAHNVQIGEDCIIVSQVGISGSTKLGDRVTLAGQVGVIGHIEIGNGAVVAAQSGVGKSIPAGGQHFGSPSVDFSRQKRIIAAMHSLPEHVKTIRSLEKRIAELEARLNGSSRPPID